MSDKAISNALSMWLMPPERVELMIARQATRPWPTAAQLEEARQAQAKALRRVSGRIGILPIYGIIEQRTSAYGYYGGGFSTDLGEQRVRDLLNAKEVDAIVLDIDSPGGSSYGVEEFGEVLYDARKVKPIYGIANSEALSAGYWIGSSATLLFVTPGGEVGSVGVWSAHIEYSKALDEAGIKVTMVRAGKYKADINPWEPLSTAARDHLQEGCDECYTKFVKAVARNRGVSAQKVRDEFGQGRTVMAERALAAKMVDRVASLTQVLEKLAGGSAAASAAREARVEVLRLRHEHRKRQRAFAREG